MNFDRIADLLSSAGCFGPEYKSLIVLRDMNGPTGINYSHSFIATRMRLFSKLYEEEVAKNILDHCIKNGHNAVALYEYIEEDNTIRFASLKITT